VLANGCTTTAFTYVGEEITQAIYWNGSIGAAKKDLDDKVLGLRASLAKIGGDARVSGLKAVVTQASSAIPTMPLYLSLLFKVMKAQGTHEGCIEQLDVLYDILYGGKADGVAVDLYEISDLAGYKADFLRLFGFGVEGVDYEADVNPDVKIANLVDLT